jgi:GNAT superfamily N-acetyltransferase
MPVTGPIKLSDGTAVVIRPVRPDDRPHFEQGLRELSARSLFHRFHGTFRPTSKDWDYLTRVDQHDHLAVCAVQVSDTEDHGAGVARCVRRSPDGRVAEIAITVVDRYQGKGVGSMLLAALSRAARREGIETFVGYVESDRRRLLRFLASLPGASIQAGDGVAEVHFPVLDDPDLWPDTPYGRLGRSVLDAAA